MTRTVGLYYRPCDPWPDEDRTKPLDRESSAIFRNAEGPTRLDSTEELLRREVRLVHGTEAIVELVAPARAFLVNGAGLKGNVAPPEFPGVIVRVIGSDYGDLRYSCDHFEQRARYGAAGWEANLRAIVLTLEALRKVDRYGTARRGEQYRGFAALGAGTPLGQSYTVETITLDEAARILAAGIEGMSPQDVLDDDAAARTCYRLAAKRLHPDNLHTGNPEAFRRLNLSWNLLADHHGVHV